MDHDQPQNSKHSLTRTLIHKGKKFDFEMVTFPGRDGKTIAREVVRHPGSVVTLPVLHEPGRQPRVVFIRNFRPSIEKELLELPAGTRETGEDPAACAARELIEETGYQAATLTLLTRFHTTPGMTDELMWAFLATGLREVGRHPEEDERIVVMPVEMSRAVRLIDAGELADGKSILTMLLAQARGLLSVKGAGV